MDKSTDPATRVREIAAEVAREILHEASAELATRIEQRMRAEYGGAKLDNYVAKRSRDDRERLTRELADAVRKSFNGRNATEVARTLKISRATVYRYLKTPG